MSDIKKLIRIVRAAQHEGYEAISVGSDHHNQWLLEAASALLALRCTPGQFRHEAGRLTLSIYANAEKPSQNLVVVTSTSDNEWVSMPLRIFTGAVGSVLAMLALEDGVVYPLAEYHEKHSEWERDEEGFTDLMCENDGRLWCRLWKLMDTIDVFKIPQVLSFSQYGDRQRGALEERLGLMGRVSTYQDMADANLIP